MNCLLERIREIDPDCIIPKSFDELLAKKKKKYRFNIENMKHELEQLEQKTNNISHDKILSTLSKNL